MCQWTLLICMHMFVHAICACVHACIRACIPTYARTFDKNMLLAIYTLVLHTLAWVSRDTCVLQLCCSVLQCVAVWVPGDTYMCECEGNIPLACLYAWHHIHSTVNRALCKISSTHVNTHTPTCARTHTHVHTRINTHTHQPNPLAAAYEHIHTHIHTLSFTNTQLLTILWAASTNMRDKRGNLLLRLRQIQRRLCCSHLADFLKSQLHSNFIS